MKEQESTIYSKNNKICPRKRLTGRYSNKDFKNNSLKDAQRTKGRCGESQFYQTFK